MSIVSLNFYLQYFFLQFIAVDNAGENTTEHSKQSVQDKVQWLTERLDLSVTDLSQSRPDKASDNAVDNARWVYL